MNFRAAGMICACLLFTGCGASQPPIPICTCPAQLSSMAVALRGSNNIGIYQQLPSAAAPASTITAPGAESLVLGMTVDTPAALYVGEYPGTVAIFNSPYTAPAGTITAGISDPAALAVGVVSGSEALFVANRGANNVTVYEAGNYSAPAFTIAGLSAPDGMAFDGSGNLWVAQASSVVEFTPPFSSTSTPAATITSGLKSPSGIAFDSSGTMYVADKGNNAILAYPAGSSTPSVTVTNGISGPGNIVVAGNMSGPAPVVVIGTVLLVPNTGGNDVAEYNLPLTNTSAPAATNSSGMNQPSAIAFLNI